jgi:hypothetical protein
VPSKSYALRECNVQVPIGCGGCGILVKREVSSTFNLSSHTVKLIQVLLALGVSTDFSGGNYVRWYGVCMLCSHRKKFKRGQQNIMHRKFKFKRDQYDIVIL